MRWLAEKSLFGLARWALALIVLVALALAMWWVIDLWTSGATVKVEAKLAEDRAEAAIESGQDAVEAVGQQGALERDVDRITEENEREIRSAPGANEPVPPAVSDALLASLCKRAAYRDDPRCVQRSAP